MGPEIVVGCHWITENSGVGLHKSTLYVKRNVPVSAIFYAKLVWNEMYNLLNVGFDFYTEPIIDKPL